MIALFDSGFGGLTVARAVIDLLPDEPLVYLGDTGRYPYGPRPREQVREFAIQIADELVLKRHADVLVVACNTAAASALDVLRERYDVPVVGVIDPGIRAALAATTTGRIGVIGTVGTIDSGVYQQRFAAADPTVDLCALACPGFVEFVERGDLDSSQVHVLAQRLLAPAVEAGIDTLLLGCTHYPYLARTINDVMGREVVLVSSADETAFELRSMLERCRRDAGMSGKVPAGSPGGVGPQFVTTGDVSWFTELGAKLLGPELAAAESLLWD